MIRDPSKLAEAERFDHLVKVIASERFLKKEGLGSEVPFFICPFNPRDAITMAGRIEQLVKRLSNESPPVRVLTINLYDLSVALLRQRDIWDRILQMEPTIPKSQLKELLQNVLDPETHLMPAIQARMSQEEFDVLFLSGVGEVFPYIRSHAVLNNLQRIAKDRPTVLFFPGQYVQSAELGASLVLFERLRGDQYYRAFNIYHFDV